MTITYTTHVKELTDDGLTDEQIAQHLSARTSRAIQCSDARMLLLETQAIVIDPVTGGRSGPLIDYYSTTDGDTKHLLGWFVSHVLDGGQYVSTDEYPRSVQFESVVAALPVELQAIGDAVVQLGGGRPHPGTSVDDVVQARDQHDAEITQQQQLEEARLAVDEKMSKLNQKISEYINPLRTSHDSDDNNWITAIQNIAATWSD